MKTIAFLILTAACSMLCRQELTAQEAASSPPEVAIDLHQKFLEAEAEIKTPISELNSNFAAHLKKLVATRQQEGALDDVLEIVATIEALEGNLPVAPSSKGAQLAAAKEIYFKSLKEKEEALASSMKSLLRAYEQQLETLAVSLTKDGDLEAAVAVKDHIASLADQVSKYEEIAALSDPAMRGLIDWEFLEAAVTSQQLEKIAPHEIEKTTYDDISDQPRLLVGLKLNMNDISKQKVVRGIQAIFLGSDGREIVSEVSPGTKNIDTYRKVTAMNGFAVGAVETLSDPHVRKLRIHFYRVIGKRLNPDDSYTSDWYGNWPDGAQLEKVDAGDRIPVGIHGRSGLGIDSVGLVVIQEP